MGEIAEWHPLWVFLVMALLSTLNCAVWLLVFWSLYRYGRLLISDGPRGELARGILYVVLAALLLPVVNWAQRQLVVDKPELHEAARQEDVLQVHQADDPAD